MALGVVKFLIFWPFFESLTVVKNLALISEILGTMKLAGFGKIPALAVTHKVVLH